MRDGRSVYGVLVGKAEGKNHWGDPGVDGEGSNIKADLQEVGFGGMDWIELSQAGTCECGNGPWVSIK
jgi:hypothetical protein